MKKLFTILLIVLASCSKLAQPETGYAMIVDKHSLDTTILYIHERYIQQLGFLAPAEAIKIDTAKDLWFIDCNLPDRLQHLYYTKNGIKIQKQ